MDNGLVFQFKSTWTDGSVLMCVVPLLLWGLAIVGSWWWDKRRRG